VTLIAVADPGFRFAGWSGDCAGTADCKLVADSAKAVQATFVPQLADHRLTVTLVSDPSCASTGSARVDSLPAGLTCVASGGSTVTCTAGFAHNTSISLTAQPLGTTSWVGFTGACNSSTTSCSLVMDADKSVTATYCGLFG
jgi:hypothetical protein